MRRDLYTRESNSFQQERSSFVMGSKNFQLTVLFPLGVSVQRNKQEIIIISAFF